MIISTIIDYDFQKTRHDEPSTQTGMELREFPSLVHYSWEAIENSDFLPGIHLDSDEDLLD
ncbi:MAG: hypothetical protein WBV73_24425 [Phormidium sp.]